VDHEVVVDPVGVEHAVDELGEGRRRDVGVGVDLPVRMGDRGADLRSTVLEDEHVVDVGPGSERLGPLGPEVDDAPGAGVAEAPELGVVLGVCTAPSRSARRASTATGWGTTGTS
jgi:hypothetical protein